MLQNQKIQKRSKRSAWQTILHLSASFVMGAGIIGLLLVALSPVNQVQAGAEIGLEPLDVGEIAQQSRPISGRIFVDLDRNGYPHSLQEGGLDPAEVSGFFPARSLGLDEQVGYGDFEVRAIDVEGEISTGTIRSNGLYVIETAALSGDDFIVELLLPGDYTEALNRPNSELTNPKVSHLRDVTSAGVRDHHIGVMPPSYCPQENGSGAWLFATCFVKGDREDPGGPQDVWVGIDYTNPTTETIGHYFTKREIGSIWGVAYDEWTGIAYSSAFLKRHAELGPEGLDGLYWFEYRGGDTTIADTTLYSASLGDAADVGGNPTSYSQNFPGGDLPDRDVNTAPHDELTYDHETYPYIAKTGIGGIDLSSDGNTLAVVNLDAKAIATYDTSRAENGVIRLNGELLLSDEAVACPNTNGSSLFDPSDWYPFAVTFMDTETLYVGVVCTAQSGLDDLTLTPENIDDNLVAKIIEVRIDGQSRIPLEVADTPHEFRLDYDRGCAFAPRCDDSVTVLSGTTYPTGDGNGNFHPWDDAFTLESDRITFGVTNNSPSDAMIFYPQPILSAITFDMDGDLNLSLLDRFGHQTGFDDPPPIDGDQRLFRNGSAGEMVKLCNVSGDPLDPEYRVEGPDDTETALDCPTAELSLGGPNPNDINFNGGAGFIPNGPDQSYAEFYDEEEFGGHLETSMGGAWQPPRKDEMVTSQINPLATFSGGLTWFSTATGDTLMTAANSEKKLQLYRFDPDNNPDSAGVFSKANGLGDIAGCALPVEIGDRVWLDFNRNGVQDPNEQGLANVSVSLLEAGSNQPLMVTRTDDGGYYYFDTADGLLNAQTYVVRFDISAVSNIDPALRDNLELTTNSPAAAARRYVTDPEEIDSDATNVNGVDQLIVNPFSPGFVGHTWDVGYAPAAQSIELGDLPAQYGTLLADNGPFHFVRPDLGIGERVDPEPDGQPSILAAGDDANGVDDDEEGVTFEQRWDPIYGVETPLPVEGQPVTVVVTIDARITATAGTTATVGAWLDLDGNGLFENNGFLTEFQTFQIDQSEITTLEFLIPEAGPRLIYSRFRIAFDADEVGTIDRSRGPALSGEVEDHVFPLEVQQPPLVELGDLPNGYGTLLADNGPVHAVTDTLGLGPDVDPEDDGHPSLRADGDDNDNRDDEDGVTFGLLDAAGNEIDFAESGDAVTVVVTVSSRISAGVGSATVGAWLDLDGDGLFTNSATLTEFQTFQVTQSGSIVLLFPIPAVTAEIIYSRFRIAFDASEVGTIDRSVGPAQSGEVEDHILQIQQPTLFELGDLPERYGTLLADNGPNHVVVPGLGLGDQIDIEPDGQPAVNADGDDNNEDDEDGVQFNLLFEPQIFFNAETGDPIVQTLPVLGQPVTLVVTVTSRISDNLTQSATAGAWLDLNGDDKFENTETLIEFQTFDVTRSGETTLFFHIPEAVTQTIYSRFRIAYDQNEVNTIGRSLGPAQSGEVEDHIYEIVVVDPEPPVGLYREYGDLPDYYGTLIEDDGPVHQWERPTLRLGKWIDGEEDGNPKNEANGDDHYSGVDDEDGIKFSFIYEEFEFFNPETGVTETGILEGEPVTLTVLIEARAIDSPAEHSEATVGAWIDLNNDGKFENGPSRTEFVSFRFPISDQRTTIFTKTLDFPIPEGFKADPEPRIYSRFRIAYDQSEVGTIDKWVGQANSGEVEDYVVEEIPNAVELVSFTGRSTGDRTVRLEWITAAEINNLGFRIYRGTGPSILSAEPVGFLPSDIQTGAGTTYHWVDSGLPSHGSYRYWLVDVDLDGTETVHGPLEVTVPRFWRYYLPLAQGE